MSLVDTLLGKPLANAEESGQRIGPAAGIGVFGLDALSSAAYGPEAALTILIPAGLAGLAYVLPIMTAIIVLLIIVYFSYRQTIAAYPSGGGSYTVARENLGARAGLLAAAALMTDYVLNVAVGISAGVGALVSAAPSLQPHTLSLCLAVLVLLTIVNLRGVREAGVMFMLPTYLFVGCLLGAVAWGIFDSLSTGGHPHTVGAPAKIAATGGAVSLWLLLKAFASGCTAMTGVEAVSNGVQAFREPVVSAARKTLTAIIAILVVLLAGIAYLVKVYHIPATPPGQPGYQSVLSQLIAAIAGKGAFYFVSIGSILAVLCLSANTSFADFPRLCRVVAIDGYMPRSFANRGRRLVYSEGIYVLAVLAGLLLIIFGGVTDRLIPLFAVGAFMAFTLSQAGMVQHWRKSKEPGKVTGMAINGLGAIATAITIVVVLLAKFIEGAWVVVLLVPFMIIVMTGVRRHYKRVERETAAPPQFEVSDLHPPLVVVPIERWSKTGQQALRFALTLSKDVQAVHVECGDETEKLCREWESRVQEPARERGLPAPELVLVKSPYRFVIQPIVNFVLSTEREHPDRTIAVVLPELVERHWYHYFLHNQRAQLLAAQLLLKGNQRIVIVNVPWYLKS